MSRFWIVVSLYAVSLFFPPQYAVFLLHAELAYAAASSPTHAFTANRILDLAATLMNQKEYYRAITEYRRFLYSFPQDKRRAAANFRVGLAFYRGADYGEALRVFQKVADLYPESNYGRLARLWQGECLMRQSLHEAAGNLYGAVSESLKEGEAGEHAVYRRAWAFLYQRKWQKARELFRNLPVDSLFRETAHDIAGRIPDVEHASRKSPLLAGVLSTVLPGSGQFYVGRKGDAWLAFMLNGLFVAGIIEALNEGRPEVAGMLAIFEAGWYGGNIYGAINGARKHNLRKARRFIRQMEDQFPYEPPSASPAAGLLGIQLGLGF